MVSHLLCTCHRMGPGVTPVNMTLSLWSPRGVCHALPFLSCCHSTPSAPQRAVGEACAQPEDVCPCGAPKLFRPRAPQGCRVPASVLKSTPHRICFAWSCGSPASISTSTRSSCTAPSGSFHHLSFHNQLKRPGWRGGLVGETDRFVSSDFLALLSDPPVSPAVLFSPSPFPRYKRELLLLGLASAVGKGGCFF